MIATNSSVAMIDQWWHGIYKTDTSDLWFIIQCGMAMDVAMNTVFPYQNPHTPLISFSVVGGNMRLHIWMKTDYYTPAQYTNFKIFNELDIINCPTGGTGPTG